MLGRDVHGSASARSADRAYLLKEAAGGDVTVEDLRVACERDDSLLDARPSGVVEPDHRAAGAHGQVHHLADLLRVRAAERAAEDGEVLGEDEHLPALDHAVPGDHAVAEDRLLRHSEVVRAVRLELVQLDEAAGIEQELDPLARGELSLLVLPVDPFLTAAQLGLGVQRGELVPRRQTGEALLPPRRRHTAGPLLRHLLALIAHARGNLPKAALWG